MLLRTLRALALLAVLVAGPAAAQAPAPPAAAPPAVSAEEIERLVQTLQDEGARTRLVEQLKGLVAAQRGIEEEEGPTDPVTWFGQLSKRLDAIAEEVLAAVQVVLDVPRVVAWTEDQLADAGARERWLEAALKLGIIFGFALFAEWGVRAGLRRAQRVLEARLPSGMAGRLAVLAVRAFLEALPIIAFAAVAYFILPLTQPRYPTERIASIFIEYNVAARVVIALARTILLPLGFPFFLGLTEETRAYLTIWIRRFTNVAAIGWAIAEGGWWFGIPGGVYAFVYKITGLVLAVLGIIFVLQNRGGIAEWLRGRAAEAGRERMAEERAKAGWRAVRNRLADVWHVLAIVYIVGIWAVYALRIEGGFFYIARATIISLVVTVGARILVMLMRRTSQRGFAISPDVKARFPTLEQRANRYLPLLTTALSFAIYVIAGLTVLQAWDVGSFAWFGSVAGRKLTSGVVSIGIVLLVALLAWEIFSSAVERYLAAADPQGLPLPRSARARTLLPLFRTTVAVLLVVMVALIVLSELGVNIAPLLAGAGVVGLAIGFGSQALVKDVITGLFILIEDTLAVGDVVELGKERAGVVERISIRSIRLRDAAGAVHTVPFSEVTSVKNMTRDFAYALSSVSVSYGANLDHVTDVLRRVGVELSADPAFNPLILQPLEIIGIERMSETGISLQARMKTVAGKQWPVGREFMHRVKAAFDEEGIAMPYAYQPRYLEEERAREAEAPAPKRIKTA